jgi:hypothetical protein
MLVLRGKLTAVTQAGGLIVVDVNQTANKLKLELLRTVLILVLRGRLTAVTKADGLIVARVNRMASRIRREL